MMRKAYLLALIAVAAMPLLADVATCGGTVTSSGGTNPFTCPNGWVRELGSGLTPAGDTLSVNLINYMWPVVTAPQGVAIQYQGETQTGTSGTYLVTGGSGSGELAGQIAYDLFASMTNGQAQENYASNFIPYCCGPNGTFSVQVPFTFNVPFSLNISDQFSFSGSTAGPLYAGYSSIEDITSFSGILSVYDSNGNPLPGAAIHSEVPEPSSLLLLATIAGLLTIIHFGNRHACKGTGRRTRCVTES